MVELVNAADSKSAGSNALRVQVPLPVPEKKMSKALRNVVFRGAFFVGSW